MTVPPAEQLRRAQELLRYLRRRGRELPAGREDDLAAAGFTREALRAAASGSAPARTALPEDGSVPRGPRVRERELTRYRVPASDLLLAELGPARAGHLWVREAVVDHDGVPLQFRALTASRPDPVRGHPLRAVDVEAVRADPQTAQALQVAEGAVVLLQVVLSGVEGGERCLEFVYSRADRVRVETG